MTITADRMIALQTNNEAWRDDMINLALNQYYGGDLSGETLAIMANSLEDVRVRDTLIWHSTKLNTAGLMDVAYMLELMWNNGYQTEQVATFAALVDMFLGDLDDAEDWTMRALARNEHYSLAQLCWVSLANGMPVETLKMVFRDMDYQTVRHGA